MTEFALPMESDKGTFSPDHSLLAARSLLLQERGNGWDPMGESYYGTVLALTIREPSAGWLCGLGGILVFSAEKCAAAGRLECSGPTMKSRAFTPLHKNRVLIASSSGAPSGFYWHRGRGMA